MEFYHLFDKKAFDGLSEKRDRLEAIRKILQYYLNYYSDHKFSFMGKIIFIRI
jgi:metal-responsive CopG/Arc/MetJ family transcriptional regulator